MNRPRRASESTGLLARFESDFGRDLRAFRAILPTGTEIHAADAAAPENRYFAVVVGTRFHVVPEDPRLAAPAFLGPGEDGTHGLEQIAQWERMLSNTLGTGVESVRIGLSLPPGTAWKIGDLPVERFTIAFLTFTAKDIVFPVDRESARAAGVYKIPLQAGTRRSCATEFQALTDLDAEGRDVAPKPLHAGILLAENGGGDLPFTAQSYIGGAPVIGLGAVDSIKFLNRLALDGRFVTPRDLARELVEEVDALPMPGESKSRLAVVLERVTDRTAIPAAIGHGDLSAHNLLQTPDRRVVAIDWEYARTPSAGILDFAHEIFRSWFYETRKDSFDGMFTRRGVGLFEKHRGALVPRTAPTGQLLALYFCRLYIDRVRGLDGIEMYGPRRLDRMLKSDWPF
jgi:hypothetical protein